MIRHLSYLLLSTIVIGTSLTAGVVRPAHKPVRDSYIVIFKEGAVFDPHIAAADFATRFGLRTGWVYEKSFAGFSFHGSAAAAAALPTIRVYSSCRKTALAS